MVVRTAKYWFRLDLRDMDGSRGLFARVYEATRPRLNATGFNIVLWPRPGIYFAWRVPEYGEWTFRWPRYKARFP